MLNRSWDIRNVFAFLILAVGMLAYQSIFEAGFVFDDIGSIENNLRLRHVVPASRAEWMAPRMLTDTTFALNYAVGGLRPADFHAVNLAFHLAASLLLFGVLRRTARLPLLPGPLQENADVFAFVVAAVWVVHPLTTSAVTYTCQRYEVMMAVFLLLTLYCVNRGATSEKGGRWHLAAVVACFLGMQCKETMVVAPLVVLLYDRVFLALSWRGVARRGWLHVALFGVVAVAYWLPLLNPGAMNPIEPKTQGAWAGLYYALTQCEVLLHYLRLSVWPHPLVLDYFWLVVETPRTVVIPVVLVVLLGAGVLAALARRPQVGFLGAVFFLLLAPTSSIIPRPDIAFEHRMYLPLAAVLALIVLGVFVGGLTLVSRGKVEDRVAARSVALLVMFAIMAMGMQTYTRNQDYVSEEKIWRDVIAKRPGNIRAYVNVSGMELKKGRPAEALELCQEALRHLPDFSDLTVAEIVRRGTDLNVDRLHRQVSYYSRIHNNLGQALWDLHRNDEARIHFAEAVRLIPDNINPQVNLACMLFSEGKAAESVAMLREILARHPGESRAREFLGNALRLTGDVAGAAREYERAMKDNLLATSPKLSLAWILATTTDDALRDGPRAVTLARELIERDACRTARAYDTLATAYATTGDFAAAAKLAAAARALATDAEKPAIEKHLDAYKSGRPWRE